MKVTITHGNKPIKEEKPKDEEPEVEVKSDGIPEKPTKKP